jgi:hypothetical protein
MRIPGRSSFAVIFGCAIAAVSMLLGISLHFHATKAESSRNISTDCRSSRPLRITHRDLRSTSGSARNRQLRFSREDRSGGVDLRGEFAMTRDSLTPEQAREFLERSRTEIANLDDRSFFAHSIIRCLCDLGYAEEAWNLIDEGYGHVRSKQIDAFFGSRSLPLAFRLRMLETLGGEEDRSQALGGLLLSMSSEELVELDFRKLNAKSRRERTTIESVLAMTLQEFHELEIENGAANAAALLRKAGDFVDDGILGFGELNRILQSDWLGDGFNHWDFIRSRRWSEKQDGYRKTRALVIGEMVKADADRAIHEVLAYENRNPGASILVETMSAWFEQDSRGANEWASANLPSLPRGQRQRMICALANVALEFRETESALRYAELVEDVRICGELLKSIEKNERMKPIISSPAVIGLLYSSRHWKLKNHGGVGQ